MTEDHSPPAPPPDAPIEELIHHRSPEVLLAVAADRRLNEDLALTLLARRDLQDRVLEELSKNHSIMKSRKVMSALVRHPRTPRHVSIPLARRLFTFELLQIALTPGVAADLKMVIEEAIMARLETITSGERLTLARRGSTRIAAALLFDTERRIIETALQNPFLTERWIVKALMNDAAPADFVDAVCRHEKWSLRREIRLALLRNQHTPLARAIAIAESLPAASVRDVLHGSRLPENIRIYLEQQLAARK